MSINWGGVESAGPERAHAHMHVRTFIHYSVSHTISVSHSVCVCAMLTVIGDAR